MRHSLWQFLTELNQQGTTIILTTHYLEEAEHLCKHAAIIDHGDIIQHANMKTLINQLHTQTIILDLSNTLDGPLNLDPFSYRLLDKNSLEVEVNKSQSLNNLFQLLDLQKITIVGMRNKTNRLEELFVRLIREHNPLSSSTS